MPEIKPEIESLAKIKVVGVGGSGGNVINRMISADIRGVEFIAINTDLQALHYSKAPVKLHVGKQLTKGLGAGMNPEIGRKAAEENIDDIRNLFKGADMVFITCGLGGGTGSGVSPIVAQVARECGALTVGVVTKPFSFEQAQRQEIADRAHDELVEHVDTIITVNNDRVLDIVDKNTSLLEAFRVVDDVLRQGVQGISEVITTPALINVDFADVRAIMFESGSALMGVGIGTGENRAATAAKAAISSPLLDVSIDGAKGILFMIAGGIDLSMHEVNEAAKIITDCADNNAKVIFGASVDESMRDAVRITVIATGFGDLRSKVAAKTDRFMYSRTQPFSALQLGGASASQGASEAPVKKPFVTFETPFKKKEVPTIFHKEETSPLPTQTFGATMVSAASSAPELQEAKDTDEEINAEDLEIPTFLRRKLR